MNGEAVVRMSGLRMRKEKREGPAEEAKFYQACSNLASKSRISFPLFSGPSFFCLLVLSPFLPVCRNTIVLLEVPVEEAG